jgi:hypothetical protein
MMTDKPKPGSAEAVDLGCLCARMDNNHGRGPGPFWITMDCPLHGDPQWAEALAKGDLSRFYEEDDTLPHSEDDA